MNRRFMSFLSVALVMAAIVISSFSTARAQSREQPANAAVKNCGIKNFGEVNPEYYRGAQPEGSDYKELAGLGIKTVIDLENDGDPKEESEVKAAGMTFFRLQMSDRAVPPAEEVSQFLTIVNEPANQPVFVHCHGGKHRTGALTAVYRMTHDGWTASRAFEEMKSYNFTHGFGHGSLKDFVFDYYSHLTQQRSAAAGFAADNLSKEAVANK